MPNIQVLPKQVSELIAAGEVVERPASVIKELVENSIDAGAHRITVEIKQGGIAFIRITDDGCGIARDDVPLAFLRHATSKIRAEEDLAAIGTLGFRGEALAAISSVAKVELFTKTPAEENGTHYVIEGGEERLSEEAGCPDGTTIIIRDLFYNTPARMKFLKKDVSEANAAGAVVDRIALSHPEISFQMIRDGKQTMTTAGVNKPEGTVYSVLGREFAGTLIPVNGVTDRIQVKGLTCKPISCRPTRNHQFIFLNGRLVRSGTVSAAVEQAYKNSAMIGKFPGFVLYITLPYDTVDVNVHPAKTEVRFSDERRVFDAVYFAVKNALTSGDTRPEIKLKTPAFNPYERLKTEQYRQQKLDASTPAEQIYLAPRQARAGDRAGSEYTLHSPLPFAVKQAPVSEERTQETPDQSATPVSAQTPETTFSSTRIEQEKPIETVVEKEEEESPEIRLIGEAFSTYIIVQTGDSVYMIDKHAAHERILFNRFKQTKQAQAQVLLSPVTVTLSGESYTAVTEGLDTLKAAGFEVEDFGNSTVLVRTVPATLTKEDVPSLMEELAENLMKTDTAEVEVLENLFHTVACKAAIKAGNKTPPAEMLRLAEQVLTSRDVMYCPHGRPVAFEIKKRELEKQFGRIQ